MKYLATAFLIATTITAFAQTHDYSRSRCIDYHTTHCEKSDNIYYRPNSASRSALFHKGQKSRTILEAYNGRDYRISICFDEVFEKPVIFRIIDKAYGDVLYDNSKDNFARDFEFTVTQNVELWIEIEVQGESDLNSNQISSIIRRDNNVGCVGVMVEYMVTPRKGF